MSIAFLTVFFWPQLQNNANLQLNGAIRAPYFAGYSAAIASQIPYGMAVFGTYETLKTSTLKAYPEAPKLPVYLASAVAGDIIGSLVLTPGEVFPCFVICEPINQTSD
jgi:hypothetical protein